MACLSQSNLPGASRVPCANNSRHAFSRICSLNNRNMHQQLTKENITSRAEKAHLGSAELSLAAGAGAGLWLTHSSALGTLASGPKRVCSVGGTGVAKGCGGGTESMALSSVSTVASADDLANASDGALAA